MQPGTQFRRDHSMYSGFGVWTWWHFCVAAVEYTESGAFASPPHPLSLTRALLPPPPSSLASPPAPDVGVQVIEQQLGKVVKATGAMIDMSVRQLRHHMHLDHLFAPFPALPPHRRRVTCSTE